MRFYEVTYARAGSEPAFYGTQADAHDAARGHPDRARVYIDEVEVPTDKAGLLVLLNAPVIARLFPTLRTWRLSPRGGLVDAPTRGAETVEEDSPLGPVQVPLSLGGWPEAAARFGFDPDQFPGDDALKRVVIAALQRLGPSGAGDKEEDLL